MLEDFNCQPGNFVFCPGSNSEPLKILRRGVSYVIRLVFLEYNLTAYGQHESEKGKARNRGDFCCYGDKR